MMGHKEIEGLIQKRMDREITKDEEILLFQHLKKCKECQDYYLEMERVKDEIASLIEFFPGQDFNARVLNKIGVKKSKLLRRLMPVFIGLYLASLILLLFSPLVNYLSSKILLATPDIFHILDKIKPIGNGILLLASSFIKLNLEQIFIGLLLTIVVFYAFIRGVKKEEKWGFKNSY
ncbi:MAG: hypothetical protein ABIL02_05215 [candidate division WOR-3 bacterium]